MMALFVGDVSYCGCAPRAIDLSFMFFIPLRAIFISENNIVNNIIRDRNLNVYKYYYNRQYMYIHMYAHTIIILNGKARCA